MKAAIPIHAIFCIFADCLIDTSEKTLKNEIKWQ